MPEKKLIRDIFYNKHVAKLRFVLAGRPLRGAFFKGLRPLNPQKKGYATGLVIFSMNIEKRVVPVETAPMKNALLRKILYQNQSLPSEDIGSMCWSP